jgi:transcriptional regulator GlxA family with amidase domain
MKTEIRPTDVTFLLVDQFSAMCLISSVEALRAANHVMGKPAYRWRMVSQDGGKVTASNGMVLDVEGSLAEEIDTDYFFVVASLNYDPPGRSKLNAFLRRMDMRGTTLGAISLGTWILARAGLMDKAKCTLHWEGLPAFRETFPEIAVVNDLYVIDRNRCTASGGIAGMEMMLDIIAREHAPEIAIKVANNFQLDRIRNATSHQRSGSLIRMDTMPPVVQKAVEIMLENLEAPLANSEIAARLATSVRNLERSFKSKLNTSPSKYYLSLRLEKARELLTYTNLATLDVALQCGFSSSSYFARCFMREFAMKPSQTRKRA